MNIQTIGKGTFGVVYYYSGYAAKTPYSKSELHLLKLCQGHPNIIRLYGEHHIESNSVLLMEHMDLSLYQYEQMRCTIDVELEKSYAHQLLSGLAHIHSKGVVHGDVKPSNMMVGNKGILKIIDFGSACKAGDKSITRHNLFYRPPETTIIASTSQDMWAAACVIGEMFCGSQQASVEKYIEKVDKEATDLLRFMFKEDPSERPTAVEVLSHPYFN